MCALCALCFVCFVCFVLDALQLLTQLGSKYVAGIPSGVREPTFDDPTHYPEYPYALVRWPPICPVDCMYGRPGIVSHVASPLSQTGVCDSIGTTMFALVYEILTA